jgi:hypothetical protein
MLDAFARCEAGETARFWSWPYEQALGVSSCFFLPIARWFQRASGNPSALAFVVDSLRLIESPARALGAAVVRRFSQMTAVAPVGRRPLFVHRPLLEPVAHERVSRALRSVLSCPPSACECWGGRSCGPRQSCGREPGLSRGKQSHHARFFAGVASLAAAFFTLRLFGAPNPALRSASSTREL